VNCHRNPRPLDISAAARIIAPRGRRTMQITEVLVVMTVMTALTVMLSLLTRLVANASLNRTIREALRSHPDSVPALVERLDRPAPWGDALLGWIFLALAVAMALYGLTESDPAERTELLRGTIIPVVIGVAVLSYARITARGVKG
jgi:hypothetical protein